MTPRHTSSLRAARRALKDTPAARDLLMRRVVETNTQEARKALTKAAVELVNNGRCVHIATNDPEAITDLLMQMADEGTCAKIRVARIDEFAVERLSQRHLAQGKGQVAQRVSGLLNHDTGHLARRRDVLLVEDPGPNLVDNALRPVTLTDFSDRDESEAIREAVALAKQMNPEDIRGAPDAPRVGPVGDLKLLAISHLYPALGYPGPGAHRHLRLSLQALALLDRGDGEPAPDLAPYVDVLSGRHPRRPNVVAARSRMNKVLSGYEFVSGAGQVSRRDARFLRKTYGITRVVRRGPVAPPVPRRVFVSRVEALFWAAQRHPQAALVACETGWDTGCANEHADQVVLLGDGTAQGDPTACERLVALEGRMGAAAFRTVDALPRPLRPLVARLADAAIGYFETRTITRRRSLVSAMDDRLDTLTSFAGDLR